MAKQSTATVDINKMAYYEQMFLITDKSTPVSSLLAKETKIRGSVFDIAMNLNNDSDYSAVPDGTDVSVFSNALENAAVAQQRQQKIRKTWMVTDEQMETGNPIAIADQKANAASDAMIRLARAIDCAICSDQEAAAPAGSAGPKLRGLGAWIKADNTAIPEKFRTPSAQIADTATLTEQAFDDVLSYLFEQSNTVGNYQLVAGTSLKKRIKTFTRLGVADTNALMRVNMPSGDRTLSWAVNIYDSDFGLVHIVPSNNLGRASGGGITTDSRKRGYLLDPSTVKLSFSKDITQTELENKGGGPRGFVEARCTLVVKAPSTMAKFN